MIKNCSEGESECKTCENLRKTKHNEPIHYTSGSMKYEDVSYYSCSLSLFGKRKQIIPDIENCERFRDTAEYGGIMR